MPFSPTDVVQISGPGLNPHSIRGVQQSLQPIDQAAQVEWTVNGEPIDISASQFRRYRSTIACTDVMFPAFDGLWPGMPLTVDCACHLAYKTSGGSPQRDVVPGSSYIYGAFTFYRPRMLVLIVSGPEATYDAYGGMVGWRMDLVEWISGESA